MRYLPVYRATAAVLLALFFGATAPLQAALKLNLIGTPGGSEIAFSATGSTTVVSAFGSSNFKFETSTAYRDLSGYSASFSTPISFTNETSSTTAPLDYVVFFHNVGTYGIEFNSSTNLLPGSQDAAVSWSGSGTVLLPVFANFDDFVPGTYELVSPYFADPLQLSIQVAAVPETTSLLAWTMVLGGIGLIASQRQMFRGTP